MNTKNKKLTLYGFNNLTKTLSFNIYDICYTKTETDRKQYIDYIDEQYNSERLTKILTNVADIIGANILNIAKQDYEPIGASVTIMISEAEVPVYVLDPSCNKGIISPLPEQVLFHLDKSHLTVHTYPESHPEGNISTFRVDIDVSTCGTISPLKALDFLINSFDSDIITIDYRVRGFTRSLKGKKLFIDHNINSIQDFINPDILKRYNIIDINLHHSNMFHTKMILKDLELNNYLFNTSEEDLTEKEKKDIMGQLNSEMVEIFYGMNLPYIR